MKSEQSQAMAKKKAPKIQLEFYINEQAMLSKIAGKSVNWVHFSLKNNLDASSMRKIKLFQRMDGFQQGRRWQQEKCSTHLLDYKTNAINFYSEFYEIRPLSPSTQPFTLPQAKC